MTNEIAMTTFVLRVELHGAVSDDYDRLHADMAAAGFLRTIVLSGASYHLPTGEYRYESGGETQVAVCEKAHRIASAVRLNPEVFLTESAGVTAMGLRPAPSLGLSSALAQNAQGLQIQQGRPSGIGLTLGSGFGMQAAANKK
jgi:hypothetical protein